jgi:hypothetical protein
MASFTAQVWYEITGDDCCITKASYDASNKKFSIVVSEQEITCDILDNKALLNFGDVLIGDVVIEGIFYDFYYDVLVNGKHVFSVCYDISKYHIDSGEEKKISEVIGRNHCGSSLNCWFNDGNTYNYLVNSDNRLIKIAYNNNNYYFNIKAKLYWIVSGHTVCFKIDENEEVIETGAYFDGRYTGGSTSYKNKVELRKYDESFLLDKDKYKYYELGVRHEGPQKCTFEDVMAADNHRLEICSRSSLCYIPDLLKGKFGIAISPKRQELLELLEANKDNEDVPIDFNADNFADMVHYVQGLLVEYDPNDKDGIMKVASRYDCEDFFTRTQVQV